MAKETFLVNVDFNKNEALNMKLQNLASHPSLDAGDAGYTYWNTTDDTAYFWTGSAWLSLEASDYVHPNHSGDVTSVGDGAQTIALNAVTNAKSAQMATMTIKGNDTGGTADPQDLSKSEVLALLNVEDGADVTDAANVNTAGAVMESDYDANTILAATSDDTPVTVAIAEQKVLGRVTSGNIAALDIDSDLSSVSANHDTIPSAKATKAYVDDAILTNGSLVYQSGYNAATNTPDLDTSPSAGIKKGWTYVVTAAGDFFTETVAIGDMMIALQDTPTALAHWTVVNKNIPDIVAASETASGIIELATNAEVITGTDTERAVTPAGLQHKIDSYSASLVLAKKYAATITGDDSTVAFDVTHGLNTKDVTVNVWEVSTGLQVRPEASVPLVSKVTITFNVAPVTDKLYRVVVIG